MRSFSILLCFIVSHFVCGQALSLLDALKKNDASQFAQTIENNPNLARILLSPSTRTVFAPSDDAFTKFSTHNNHSIVSRQSSSAAKGSYQGSVQQTTFRGLGSPPGEVIVQQSSPINELDTSVIDDASTQNHPASGHDGYRKVVSNPLKPSAANITKRASHDDQNITKSNVQIFSGLGNTVNIIKGDIPYDGGVIHTVDGYFNIPQTFSKTSSQKNHTGFAGLTDKANLTSFLDSTPQVTIFIPTNEAIQELSENITNSPGSLATLLSNHVIPGFAGYLPLLIDGASYTTTLGTNISISIKNGEYSINGVRIVAPNLITTNGVAHVIDQVLFPKKGSISPPTKFISVGWSLAPTWTLFIVWGFVLSIGIQI